MRHISQVFCGRPQVTPTVILFEVQQFSILRNIHIYPEAKKHYAQHRWNVAQNVPCPFFDSPLPGAVFFHPANKLREKCVEPVWYYPYGQKGEKPLLVGYSPVPWKPANISRCTISAKPNGIANDRKDTPCFHGFPVFHSIITLLHNKKVP